MAVTYGFYDSLNHDRLYNAQQMSAIFDGIINDGVFMSVGNQFHTVAGTGMQVIVKSGRAWFDSTWTLNDAEYPLSIDAADVLLTRIDAVVLEVNSEVATRANTIKVVKGTPASTPAKPTLTNTATIHQHALAYVTVAKNTTAITNSMIEIVVGKTETPYVTAILQTTDITDLFKKWESDFQIWFETVKGTLDGDVALNLQNQITTLERKISLLSNSFTDLKNNFDDKIDKVYNSTDNIYYKVKEYGGYYYVPNSYIFSSNSIYTKYTHAVILYDINCVAVIAHKVNELSLNPDSIDLLDLTNLETLISIPITTSLFNGQSVKLNMEVFYSSGNQVIYAARNSSSFYGNMLYLTKITFNRTSYIKEYLPTHTSGGSLTAQFYANGLKYYDPKYNYDKLVLPPYNGIYYNGNSSILSIYDNTTGIITTNLSLPSDVYNNAGVSVLCAYGYAFVFVYPYSRSSSDQVTIYYNIYDINNSSFLYSAMRSTNIETYSHPSQGSNGFSTIDTITYDSIRKVILVCFNYNLMEFNITTKEVNVIISPRTSFVFKMGSTIYRRTSSNSGTTESITKFSEGSSINYDDIAIKKIMLSNMNISVVGNPDFMTYGYDKQLGGTADVAVLSYKNVLFTDQQLQLNAYMCTDKMILGGLYL